MSLARIQPVVNPHFRSVSKFQEEDLDLVISASKSKTVVLQSDTALPTNDYLKSFHKLEWPRHLNKWHATTNLVDSREREKRHPQFVSPALSDGRQYQKVQQNDCCCLCFFPSHSVTHAKKEKHANIPAVAEQPTGIFGVPLRQSIAYANVAISLVDAEGKSYIYGYVPIVVAKCGVYLKEKGTHSCRALFLR